MACWLFLNHQACCCWCWLLRGAEAIAARSVSQFYRLPKSSLLVPFRITVTRQTNRFSDAGQVHLKGLTKLKRLELENTQVTRPGVF